MKRWHIWGMVVFILAFPVLLEISITKGFFGCKPITTSFESEIWFGFMASYIGAIGGTAVGGIALWQNKQYKEMSDAYQEKMDELTILAEFYPKSIVCEQSFSDFDNTKDSWNYFDGFDSSSHNKLYVIEFIVTKNPIIDLKITNVSITFHYENSEKNIDSKTSILRNIKGTTHQFYSENETFKYGIVIPTKKSTTDENPRKICVQLSTSYKNQYNMPICKNIAFTLDTLPIKQQEDLDVIAKWNVKKAKLIKEQTNE